MALLAPRDPRDPEATKVIEAARAYQATTGPRVNLDGPGRWAQRERRARQGCRASRDSSASPALSVFRDQRAPWVPRGLRESKVTPVPEERQASPVSPPRLASPDLRDLRGPKEAGGRRAPRGHLDPPDCREPRATLDSSDLLDPRVTLACRA